MSNCSVCINKLTAKATVVCPVASCEYVACKTCVQTYLLNTHLEAHCMNCRNKWNLDFVKKSLGNTFVTTDYKQHRAAILADKVIARKEEYLENASAYKTLMEDKKILNRLNPEVSELRRAYQQKYKELEQIRAQVAQKTHELERLEHRVSTVQKRVKTFTMSCQNAECRGMLDSNFYCLLCEQKTCNKCLTVIEPEHVCNPDTVATAALIIRSSKPCPKCGMRISKIDGCDQMWCVECKTAFSWNTGAIETGTLHNPHYYQWMRDNGGMPRTDEQPLEAACGNNCINATTFKTTFDKIYNIYKSWNSARTWLDKHVLLDNITAIMEPHSKLFDEFYIAYYTLTEYASYANHIREVLIPNTNQTIESKTNNMNHIYDYLIGDISKEELGLTLVSKENSEACMKSCNDILNATQMVLTQVVQSLEQTIINIRHDITHPANTISYVNVDIVNPNTVYYNRQSTVDSNNLALVRILDLISGGKIDGRIAAIKSLLTVFNEHIRNANKYLAYSNIEQIKLMMMHNSKRTICVWDFDRNTRRDSGFSTKHAVTAAIKKYEMYL